MARILLGVTGGIAAYKALDLIRLATAAGHSVRVIQTDNAQRFVGAASFAAITGAPVLTSEWERDPARGAFPDQSTPEHDPISHLELVRNADCFVIAPASANTISKLASGAADNLLTSAALAASCPLIIAPAMNHQMWQNAATQANIELLRERAVTIIDPEVGSLASRNEWGSGRLAQPATILAAVEQIVPAGARPWDGRRVLVTAGGTREPIDAVRFVGNRSSGRMGFALAEAAAARGADVTVIAANVDLPRHTQISYIEVESAAQLEAAARDQFPSCELLLMAAAVADFTASEPAPGKLKKDGRSELELTLSPTTDVLAALSELRTEGQTLVGFAAEHGADAVEVGRTKLDSKGLDALVINDVAGAEIGFESSSNEVTIVTAVGDQHVPKADKLEIAEAILDAIDELHGVRSRAKS
ncbi:MAG: bifunctional phosphopantothenoylcysteine decarboxylase/phosphopantothenate--cysteine ligase CoaBC [Solirubrobacteraceae bacterium]|nr:bifunctional phosphopantothenoylcysteine decarboxylase/phosphopantothenate--cysteine ligase CoaBC [Solirubrobacteraceae bacterium]